MYTVQVIDRERTPAKRDASGLTPTDSSSTPKAVRRVSSAVMTKMADARMIEKGRPSH
jgi:hypothetical protein